VKCEEHFEDTNLYYGFHTDVTLPSQLREKFAKLNGESHIKVSTFFMYTSQNAR